MYGLGMVLSESYLTLLLVRFGTEGLLKAGRTILEVCVRSFFKFGAKIRKIFGICKFFDAKKEEKWKKMGKMKKAELSLLVMGVILLDGTSPSTRRHGVGMSHAMRPNGQR